VSAQAAERHGHGLVYTNLHKTQVNMCWQQNHRGKVHACESCEGESLISFSHCFFTQVASEPRSDSKNIVEEQKYIIKLKGISGEVAIRCANELRNALLYATPDTELDRKRSPFRT
jgi:hypothetical protein